MACNDLNTIDFSQDCSRTLNFWTDFSLALDLNPDFDAKTHEDPTEFEVDFSPIRFQYVVHKDLYALGGWISPGMMWRGEKGPYFLSRAGFEYIGMAHDTLGVSHLPVSLYGLFGTNFKSDTGAIVGGGVEVYTESGILFPGPFAEYQVNLDPEQPDKRILLGFRWSHMGPAAFTLNCIRTYKECIPFMADKNHE